MTHATRLALTIVAFCILVAGAVLVNFALTKHAINSSNAAAQAAKVSKQDSYNLCMAGNVAREQQIQLWQYVVQLSRKPNETDAQKQQIAEFEVYLHHVFAPRNCGHL